MISHVRVDAAVLSSLRTSTHKIAVFQNLDLHATDFGKLFFLEFEDKVPAYPAPESETWKFEFVGVLDLESGDIHE